MKLTPKTMNWLTIFVLGALPVAAILFATFFENEIWRSVFAGMFTGALGALQWLVGITRERERSIWEAIRAYYSEGDTTEFRRY